MQKSKQERSEYVKKIYDLESNLFCLLPQIQATVRPTLHKTEGITVKFWQHVILKTQITFKKPKLTLLHLITQLQPLCPCPMIEKIKQFI
jgi:hypothetical protein